MSKALILIDIQNDYFKGGNCQLYKAEDAALNAVQILKKFREDKLPVVFIKHENVRPNATFFQPHTAGVEINKLVEPLSGEEIIIKHYPNSFKNTNLKTYLDDQDIDELVMVGMMTHMCVDTTVRAAFDLGYKVTLIKDACTTKDLVWEETVLSAEEIHKVMLASIHGMFANVIKTEEFLRNK